MISTCYILEWNWNLSLKRAFVSKAEEKGWRDIFCINEHFEEKNLLLMFIFKIFLLRSYWWLKCHLKKNNSIDMEDITDELLEELQAAKTYKECRALSTSFD